MAVSVPTMDEFNALEARVAALEGAPPELPSDIPPIQAKRIADLIELFGVNTFSQIDDTNVWGSYPSDYRSQTVLAALKYMTGTTKFCFGIREYHYAGREVIQKPWLDDIRTIYPNSTVTMCVSANGQVSDVASMLRVGGVTYFEGINEPNTDFGQGTVPFEQTKAIQDEVWMRTETIGQQQNVAGPAIAAGMPNPEQWIKDYCGSGLAALNAELRHGNGHYYPPSCPDLAQSGTSLAEYAGGLQNAYGQPTMITEFHPSLRSTDGNKPGETGWSGDRDAYYLLLSLYRAGKLGMPLWWYALFDYADVHICGLFPRNQQNPRPAATAMRNLSITCADPGDDLRSFAPGTLQCRATGEAGGWDWDLYQSSDGKFFIPLWLAAKDLGGPSTMITLELAKVPAAIAQFDIRTGAQLQFPEPPMQAKTFHIELDASARMIVIRP
jgi:hypothetical protein